jgi:hypothetical protein
LAERAVVALGLSHGGVRRDGGARADRHQERAGLRLADAGRHHRGRDRLGLRYIALIHIIGHACLRTLQLLRAPTLLRDYHALENAIGGTCRTAAFLGALVPERRRRWLYRFALERGYLDAC